MFQHPSRSANGLEHQPRLINLVYAKAGTTLDYPNIKLTLEACVTHVVRVLGVAFFERADMLQTNETPPAVQSKLSDLFYKQTKVGSAI